MNSVPKWLGGMTARLALTACCLMGIAACTSTERKVTNAEAKAAEADQDLNEVSRDARADWQEDWLAFKRDINVDISKNERRIMELRAEVALIDAEYRGKYNTRINDAERRNFELRDRVNNYYDQGDQKWAVFKTDVRQDFDDLATSIGTITVSNG